MTVLTELCQELKNWFDRKKVLGTFTIENGAFNEDIGLQSGQYFRIIGSVFNDGVHQQGDILIDEEPFKGAVWLMAVPSEIIDLANDIDAWIEKNCAVDSANMSPFASESFGGYSYSKGSSAQANATNISAGDWKSAFNSRLNKWRKI